MTKMPHPWILVFFAVLFLLAGGTWKVRANSAASLVIEVPPLHVPLDNEKLLKMIDLTEDWDGESVGAAGESGPWQVLPITWKDYSHQPYPYSERKWREPEAQRVLHEHASRIRDWIESHRLPDTPYTFALFWKAGFGRVIHNKCRRVDKEYAERAAHLYKTLK